MNTISIASLVHNISAITPEHTVNQVGELFLSTDYQHLLSIPVVVDNKPIGIISRHQLMEVFLKLYGRDLYGRQSVKGFVNENPLMVDCKDSLETASDYIISNIETPVSEDFIILRDGQYFGMGMVLDLLNAVGTQLDKANKKITKLNKKLTAENQRMGSELAVARQLQAMVLPDKREYKSIKQLDINGFMVPADEVGGDYYEVLQHDDHIKIAIGDVTGHGLESGVLMIMVQTVMQSLVAQNIHDLKLYLQVINKTIYNNLQRMELDKNLTLSILDYHQGEVQICGQHEEVLWVQQGKVTRIDTIDLGFLLGLETDIGHLLSTAQCSLASGDGIVLYTDGITEARNDNQKLFGLERLIKVLEKNWHLSAKELRKTVFEEVYRFTKHQKPIDDMTLVVLKQR